MTNNLFRIECDFFDKHLQAGKDQHKRYDTSDVNWPMALWLVRICFENNIGIIVCHSHYGRDLGRLIENCDLMDFFVDISKV